MRVLITGASGFIGSETVNALKELHYPLLYSRRPLNSPFPLFTELKEAFLKGKPEVVVNCVGILKEEGGNTYRKAHFDFVRELLTLSKDFGVKKFVHLSALGTSKDADNPYYRSKWEGEELVRKSKIPYLILRPSIVIGKGQKLYSDLKRLSKFLPLIVAPKMKVQPVKVEKVLEAVKKGVECSLSGTVELCGEKVLTMGGLFREVLKELGIRRPVVEVPKELLLPVALLGLFGFDYNQYKMIKDNTCGGK
ncbi:NAD-dependent epimerase/dehydratase family protein [Thermovibrio sp.]